MLMIPNSAGRVKPTEWALQAPPVVRDADGARLGRLKAPVVVALAAALALAVAVALAAADDLAAG